MMASTTSLVMRVRQAARCLARRWVVASILGSIGDMDGPWSFLFKIALVSFPVFVTVLRAVPFN